MKLMTGVAMFALMAAYATNASAADLGGDCCADLEERVAELEATTARKGNRKVSLEVYGQVTTAVMWWDDGFEDNVYVVDPQTSNTRFGFRGKAAINSDLEAGYNIELAWQTADATKVREDNDEGEDVPEFRQAHWYIKSNTWGKVRVGFADTANSGIAEIDLSNASVADGMSSSQAGHDIIFLDMGGPNLDNFEFNRRNVVRYDTPTYAGFVLSAAWGEDDMWDVALRYAGELRGFKIAAGIAYGENTDTSNGGSGVADPVIEVVNGGLSIMHMPTGLFVTTSAGQRDRDNWDTEEWFWFVSSGLERKWFTIGATTLFGMGGEYEDDDEATAHYWGLGAVQKIDAAAMDLYISYRHYELDGGVNGLADPNQDTFDTVVGGARIKF
ncbi:conserved exported protein of unknown function [Candidatus Filomicrobium marinum]|uniref:Porin domain-containing protein n=2 Tax=Filomicrobium TaxID=119044 RepID=A0A0D6JIG3_9HYPH|nr:MULTISPECIES: porin [Filomicrobium]MCV0371433.1 porin [Filomicrobium sp.]CFX35736.1 conserved exported protein of unknown function [Candidatus Filomicrobium marinum]CPR21789.1 conserved exported protein of unknown function [Candidatus Filomicrobium marinum]